MNIFKQVRERRAPDTVVQVPYLHSFAKMKDGSFMYDKDGKIVVNDEPAELTFHIKQFAPGEMSTLRTKAFEELEKRGLKNVETSDRSYKYEFANLWCDLLSEKVVGWDHKPTEGEPEEFSKQALSELLSCAVADEKAFLLGNYRLAVINAMKEAEKNAHT